MKTAMLLVLSVLVFSQVGCEDNRSFDIPTITRDDLLRSFDELCINVPSQLTQEELQMVATKSGDSDKWWECYNKYDINDVNSVKGLPELSAGLFDELGSRSITDLRSSFINDMHELACQYANDGDLENSAITTWFSSRSGVIFDKFVIVILLHKYHTDE